MNNGKLISTQGVRAQYVKVLDKYDILRTINVTKVTLHSLRHTYATRCIESGMQAKVLQHRLGHTDIQVTYNVYGDVFDKFEEENLFKADEYMTKNGLSLSMKKAPQNKAETA